MGQCRGLVSVRVREASGGALPLPTQVLLDKKSVRIYSLQVDCSNPWFPAVATEAQSGDITCLESLCD